VPRSPQGRPVLLQEGASKASQRLGSRWADALVTVQRTFGEAQGFYANVKALAAGFERDPDGLVVLPGLYPVIGSTEAEAWARKAEMDSLLDLNEERVRLAERFVIDLDRPHLDGPSPGDILDHVSRHVSLGFVENIVRELNRENLPVR
jgi:alkanesulfonate monooxygenase SsuD/methylene tetrahydromethanopterin reductase-like flavin-dependent oxidoreductase (luciferase family)